MNHPTNVASIRHIRHWVAFFIVGLILSGLTAIPLETELRWMNHALDGTGGGFAMWIHRVGIGLQETNAHHPFMAYGTDWLAFAHVVIAVAFIGAWRDPVRNVWLFEFGLIACALVIPWALLLGELRGIPLGWRLIDCSFAIGGAIPLWICRREAKRLEAMGR